jgi:hypothetical protein
MAKKATSKVEVRFKVKTKKNNAGIHSKKRTSNLKSSINYKKAYRGQGR